VIFETALYNYLSTYAGLTALIGTRIYPVLEPQNVKYPALVFQQISGPRVHAMGDDPGITYPRYQFTAWAEKHTEAVAVAKQVRLAFENYSGTMGGEGGVTIYHAEVDNQFSDHNEQTNKYCSIVDVIIWHGE
jgi:hypothetical protein